MPQTKITCAKRLLSDPKIFPETSKIYFIILFQDYEYIPYNIQKTILGLKK
jgi:hypothetical protein